MRYLLDPNADIALLESVLEEPDFVSGISDQDRALILTAAIERAPREIFRVTMR